MAERLLKQKLVAICSECGREWSICKGTCLDMPSPFADNPVLSEISKWAEEYTNELEIELTEKACLCKWIYRDNPTDVTSQQAASEGKQEFLPGPRLRVRSDEHPECPVHTRRGFLIGFYQWATTKKDFIALWSVASALEVCADEERIESEAEEAYQEELSGEVDFSEESDEVERL
jgi:hypothetical protein